MGEGIEDGVGINSYKLNRYEKSHMREEMIILDLCQERKRECGHF